MSNFPDADLPLRFEVRFDGATWVDLSSRMTKGQAASSTRGRPAGAGRASAASFGITLDNDDGALTPLNPTSVYYPNVRLDAAARARLRWFSDTFTRTSSNTWGADWTNSGGTVPDEYDVTGTAATHTHGTVNQLHHSLASPAYETPDAAATASWSATATGASLTSWTALGSDTSNYYAALLASTTAGAMQLSIVKRLSGSLSFIETAVSVGTYSPNDHWSSRLQVLPGGMIRAKAWAGDLAAEPDAWTLDGTDPAPLSDLSKIILISRRETSNTNTNPVCSWHEVQANADRAWGYTDSWQPDFVTDTSGEVHSTVRVTVSGSTRRLFQGEKTIRSPMFYSMSGIAPNDYIPYAYWPMEDGPNATQFASGIANGTPVAIAAGVVPAAFDDFVSSGPLPSLAAGAVQSFTIPSYTSLGQTAMQFALRVPSEPASTVALAEFTAASGPISKWRVTVTPGTPTVVNLEQYDSTGALAGSVGYNIDGSSIPSGGFRPTEDQFYGHWVVFTLIPEQDGGDVTSWFGFTATSTFGGVEGGLSTPGTLGRITGGRFFGGLDGLGLGHFVVYIDPAFNIVTDAANNTAAMDAYAGEAGGDRAVRTCRQQGIPLLLIGDPDASAAMGAQPIDTLEAILGEVEDADQGVLGEYELGLSYLPISGRYNQPATLTIDLADYLIRKGDEAGVLSPVYDDQNTLTESEVERTGGATAIVSANQPRSSLKYTEGFPANLADDGQAIQLAALRANRGSVDLMRFPGTPVDLGANPDLIAAWQKTTTLPGIGRIVRTGLPVAHAPYDIDELVDGWTETFEPRRWKASYNGQPAALYDVGVYGEARYDSDFTTTAEALDTTETGVDITVVSGKAGWATTASQPDAFPPTSTGYIVIGGEVMAVTASVSTGANTYTLTVTRNVNNLPGGKSHASGAPVHVYQPGIYAY